jgi:hypothetical protein
MSRDHDELSKRPDRVVILDVDDPMTEVHGEFVWKDEHDRVIEEARRQAFAEGYEAGLRDRAAEPVHVRLKRARSLRGYVRLGVLVLLGLLVLLMLPIVLF